MNLKSQLIFRIFLLGLVSACVSACQGANFSSSLESAIAPASPSPSESISEKSDKPIPTATTTESTSVKPTETPITSNSSTSNLDKDRSNIASDRQNSQGDRLSNHLIEIALQALPKSQPAEKTSLKAQLFINFANPKPQSGEFSDLETAPASLRPWIKDLNQLGTITPKTGQLFQPNTLVSRREYARWLLQTNNRLYKNQPSRQVRLAQPNDIASFPDIPNNHSDFTIIQGLANAGLIGGTGDPFRPNDPLLREELVLWKIPLDLRQPLPNATLETVSQAWGFKDSDRISENALSAIFADSQLRDISNIRRSFGFTTLLQPQKPVTRAEAAASLWYFGTATDGISAGKSLELER